MGLLESIGTLGEYLGEALSGIGSLLGFTFTLLGWVNFFLSEPTLLFIGIVTFALCFAVMRMDNVFDFIEIVVSIVFGCTKVVVEVVMALYNALMSILRVLSNIIPFT